MKELDLKAVRKKMYTEYKENKKEGQSEEKSTLVRAAQDTVLIEAHGQRHFIPSMLAFSRLTREHETLKSNHNKAVKELNVLREAVKNLIRSVNEMDDELKRKIDLPDV